MPPETYGRSALDVSASNPNIVYAQIEAGESGTELRGRARPARRPEVTPGESGYAGIGGGSDGSRSARRRTSAVDRQRPRYRGNNGRAAESRLRNGQQRRRSRHPTRNSADSFARTIKGKTWTLVSNCNSRPMYFSQLRVDPQNPNTIYVAGLPVAKSLDGGKTFATLDAAGGNGEPAHVDQHAIWIDPRNGKHLMIGNDGGLDISYDQGKILGLRRHDGHGLAYVVTADNERPYNVYTGLQDNNSWGGPSSKRGRGGITNMDWFGICGGDGFYTAVNVDHPNIVYCESQDGNTSRYDLQQRADDEHSAEQRSGRRGRPRCRRRRRHASTAGRRAPVGRWRRRRRPRRQPKKRDQRRTPAKPTASTGTRRSFCRRTTRRSSISAAIGCSSLMIAEPIGWRARISRSRSTGAKSR